MLGTFIFPDKKQDLGKKMQVRCYGANKAAKNRITNSLQYKTTINTTEYLFFPTTILPHMTQFLIFFALFEFHIHIHIKANTLCCELLHCSFYPLPFKYMTIKTHNSAASNSEFDCNDLHIQYVCMVGQYYGFHSHSCMYTSDRPYLV